MREDGVEELRWFAGGAEPFVRANKKISEQIALDIVKDIVERGLKTGDPLPLEAEMIRKFKASRPSVREALRLLEFQGLIVIRQGSRVGALVGEVRGEHLAHTLTLHMHFAGITYDELLSSWITVEPILAEGAARNPDREQVRSTMETYCSVELNKTRPMIEFHNAICALARNRPLTLMVRAVTHIFEERITSADPPEQFATVDATQAAIAAAIIAGDTARARDLTAVHSQYMTDVFRAKRPDRVGERITWL